MKVEGIKKYHLISSSMLYLLFILPIIYLILKKPTDMGLISFLASISISVSTILIFLIGLFSLVYYIVKKEESMSKVLSISNIIPSPFLAVYGAITAAMIYSIFLLFNLYLYWSREGRYSSREPITEDKGKKVLENFTRHALAFLLVLSFLGSVFASFFNPEIHFFGEKLSGGIAIIYLSMGGIAGIVIAYLLLEKKNRGEILSLLYFGYFFIETLITNLSLSLGFSIPFFIHDRISNFNSFTSA